MTSKLLITSSRTWVVGFCAFAVSCATALVTVGSASAQVVQLPTIQIFNVSTAVKVPDGGYVHLGGIKSRSAGATTRGVPGLSNIPGLSRLFKNRGIGSDTGASNVGVTTKIIILEEYEERVMAEARRRQAARADEIELDRQADRISQHVGRNRK